MGLHFCFTKTAYKENYNVVYMNNGPLVILAGVLIDLCLLRGHSDPNALHEN